MNESAYSVVVLQFLLEGGVKGMGFTWRSNAPSLLYLLVHS